jgi:hypothetical protein
MGSAQESALESAMQNRMKKRNKQIISGLTIGNRRRIGYDA